MFPYSIQDVDFNERLLELYKGELSGFCRVSPKGWFFPRSYKDHASNYLTFPVQENDVWIVTFPRSGTTMMQEILWLLCHNCDYEAAAQIPLYDRVPFFEYNIFHTEAKHNQVLKELGGSDNEHIAVLSEARRPIYQTLKECPSPRLIKTHLPFTLLPQNILEKSKVVYVARNPRDAAVSYFHHNKLIKFFDYSGSFKQYWELFESGEVVHGPYWEHIKEGWERRNHKNMKFIFYENLIKDMKGTLLNLSEFLNKSFTEEQLEKLVQHMEIDNFRKSVTVRRPRLMDGLINKTGQGFIRSGKIGSNTEFDPELEDRAKKWIEEHKSSIDITFPY